jgi:hypothetical protein
MPAPEWGTFLCSLRGRTPGPILVRMRNEPYLILLCASAPRR